jgi:hypothetical protein
MAKCKDGRKHVLVKEYKKKNGETIARYERSCPTTSTREDLSYCCVCGDVCEKDCFRELDINGETKKICDECVDTIHGLM